MVSKDSVEKQLKKVKFNLNGWGRTEARELPGIILPDEEIYEVVNGVYEGGFALAVATNVRLLLIDKKPFNYLTVEDLRFEMINEIDYSHRMLGAHISVSAGSKNLRFTSYNQRRLRKLISHVQHCIAESRKMQSTHQESQNNHMEQINQQLQTYLLAQHQQQQQMQEQLKNNSGQQTPPQPVRPSPELNDYLYAQSLLAQYQGQHPGQLSAATQAPAAPAPPAFQPTVEQSSGGPVATTQMADLYSEGMQEIFGKREQAQPAAAQPQPTQSVQLTPAPPLATVHKPIEINALKVAYSKLPMALRNRKFGRPSFHSHSQQPNNEQADYVSSPVPAPEV